MTSVIYKNLYRVIDIIKGVNTLKAIDELVVNEKLSRNEIEEIGWNKLKILINYAYSYSPYYKKVMSEINLIPDQQLGPNDISRIPILNKETFRKNIHHIIAENSDNKVSLAKTSGSTGIPLKFYKDNKSFCYSQAAMYRGHSWYGLDVGDREAMLWGIPIGFKNRLVVFGKDLMLNRFREKEYNISDEIFEDFFNKCLKKRPQYLMGYTSMVFQFAHFINDRNYNGKNLNFKMVKCTSETIHSYERDLIEKIFACKVVSEYGAAEAGLIAFECPYGNHHIMNDCCYLEIIKGDRPALEGEIGRVIITDLNNFKTPIIRYEVGDTAAYSSEKCECGRPFPIIKNIIGRSSDIVITTSGKAFHSIIFYYIMKEYTEKNRGIRQFKVHQKAIDKLEIKIMVTDHLSEDDIILLKKKIASKLGNDMQVQLTVTENIERESSGKLRDFTTDLNTNDILEKLY